MRHDHLRSAPPVPYNPHIGTLSVALELQRMSSVSDLETVFHAEGSSTAEVETLSVKALLESNGIPTVLVGDPVFPNLPFEIKVNSHQAAWARQLIAEAQLTGPAAAEAAERKFECKHALLPRQAHDEPVE